MKKRVILLAGVFGVGLGLAVIAGRPDRPPADTTVADPLTAPAGTLSPVGPVALLVPPSQDRRLEQTPAAPPSGAPANYVYWEVGDPGVWATPARFSGSR